MSVSEDQRKLANWIMDFRPMLGPARVGTEFPLREMLFRHYRNHFEEAKAKELTDSYITLLAESLPDIKIHEPGAFGTIDELLKVAGSKLDKDQKKKVIEYLAFMRFIETLEKLKYLYE